MGTLSANTLFHFTGTKENLISILQNGFYPRYCLEDPFLTENLKLAVPMVCFCDIPLSQIQNHSSAYGQYALGLRKEWAEKKGVCPVLYTHTSSYLHESIQNYVRLVSQKRTIENRDAALNSLIDHLYSIMFYMKPYKEEDQNGECKRYYDEREWRYSIKISEDSPISDIFLDKDAFNDSTKKDAANEKMIQYKLDFEPKDINYIIVPTDRDILNIRNEIIEAKFRFPDDDVRLLTTRIISMERIKEDF